MSTLFVFRRLTTGQVIFDVTLAVVCVLMRVVVVIEPVSMVFVVLLMATALALRRISPGLALAVAWLGTAVQLASALTPDPSNLAILPVLYATAAYGTTRVKWVGLISAGGGAVIAAVYIAVFPLFGDAFNALQIDTPNAVPGLILSLGFVLGALLATLGLSWTLGLLARTRRTARESRFAQQRAEAEEALAKRNIIVEQERNRIARDMHDVVAHSLAVVIAQADGARYARANDPESTVTALTTISATARVALSDVRVLLGQLRHSQGESPQPVLEDLDRLIEQMRSAGLTIARSESGERAALGSGQQLAVYRIVQEALTNALRHGDASDDVQLRFDWSSGGVKLTVVNALTTAVPAASPPVDAVVHGLVGMRERAALVGGWLTAGVRQGLFIVTANIPREVVE